jgi:hypothetical protein
MRIEAFGAPLRLVATSIDALNFRLAVVARMISLERSTMDIRPDYAAITPEEFFGWVPRQDGRYELIEGEVVSVAGTGRRHDAIMLTTLKILLPLKDIYEGLQFRPKPMPVRFPQGASP